MADERPRADTLSGRVVLVLGLVTLALLVLMLTGVLPPVAP